jgi:hypothetical protein
MAKGSVGHGKSFAVFANKYDLSNDCTEFSWPLTAATAESMGAGDSYEEFVTGLIGEKPSGTFMMNDLAGRAWDYLDTLLGAGVSPLTYAPLGATAGYPAMLMDALLTENSPSANLTSVVLHKVTFSPARGTYITEWPGTEVGQVLYNGSMNASADGTAIKLGGGISHESDDNVDTDRDLLSAAGADNKFGMAFMVDKACTTTTVRLWLKKIGAPAGNLVASIFSDNGAGLPSATLGDSDNVLATTPAVVYGWIEFHFATPVNLEPNTKYHLVLSAAGYTYNSGVTEVDWGTDASSPRTTGYFTTYNGGTTTWTAHGTNQTAAYQVHALGETMVGHIHATTMTNTSLDVKIQDAPDNSTWADVLTFAQLAAAGSQREDASNAVTDEDVRITATIVAAGTSTFMVSAAMRY